MSYIKKGDCLELMKEISDKSVNLVLMDPPYNIGKDKKWDKWKTKEAYVEFMITVFKECERVLADNGSMYFFHNDIEQIAMLMEAIREKTGFIFNSFITCNKPNFRGDAWHNWNHGNEKLRSWFNTCEYCLYYVKIDNQYKEDKTGWDSVRLDTNNFSSLRKYAYDMLVYIGGGKPQTTKYINGQLGHRKAEHFFYCSKKERLRRNWRQSGSFYALWFYTVESSNS